MIYISIIARDLNLPPEKVQRTVELLDAGNTIPFITRFRKDETGGLNEQQILSIKRRAGSLRALAERKAFVLKSIESQGKLTDELKVAVDKASTSRAIEDVYLPFKPKKKSRAQDARQKGLGPLAEDIFNGVSPEVDLATRATDYVRVDKGLKSVDEVIRGVGDLLAERFADDAELRQQLRKMIHESGKLTAQTTVKKEEPASDASKSGTSKSADAAPKKGDQPKAVSQEAVSQEAVSQEAVSKEADSKEGESEAAEPKPVADAEKAEVTVKTMPAKDAAAAESSDEPKPIAEVKPESEPEPEPETKSEAPKSSEDSSEPAASESAAKASETKLTETKPAESASDEKAEPVAKKKKKKKKKKAVDDPFKDYHNFKQPIKKFPHHRVLAINRGERAGKLKVKIECDEKKIQSFANEKLIADDHPFAEHLKTCLQDALSRLILPSLEREIRREMTEAAEKHAVEVFASNLQNLLLQPPIRNRRVLAIDPGYKRGCSVAIIEKNGDLLHSDHVFVVGNQTRRDESKKKVADLVNQYNIELIGIGNGAACREAEQMVSDCIELHLKDNAAVRYVMVNEAGASIYSTSEVGREELPDETPAIRSAVSIGRRLQDPMSELVKISPANIGVGMYQHDVKAKHLSESLDDVVQFCVNQVGVDANTASPSLLRYVSGLNALTAKRLVEFRTANGGFKNRQQLKEVSGFGDATFVQAAGFLRISNGDVPLDATSIHPESYPVAEQIISRVNSTAEELFPRDTRAVESAAVAVKKELSADESVAAEASSAETSTVDDSASEAPAGETSTVETPPVESAVEAKESEQPTEPTEPAIASEVKPAAETAVPSKETTASADAAKVPPQKSNSYSAEFAEARKKRREIVDRISALDFEALGKEIDAGQLLLTDIVRALKRPDWDPREKARKPVFRRGMIKTDDLTVGMQLDAQVVNVVDFGVFVDIGLGESCLVHVSQLSNRFIADPQVMFAVGDVIRTWVSEIEPKKRRVKLTAIRPGTERSARPPRSRKPAGEKKSGSRSGTGSDNRRRERGNKPGGKPGGRNARGHSGHSKTRYQKPKAPKVVKPITEEMLKGDAPMTSFSDLIQFVKKKPETDSKGE